MEKEIIHKGDFVEVEYTGRIKESSSVFDTTNAKVAEESNIFNENAAYSPVVICIGEGHIIPSLDDLLDGKEVGREYKFELTPEKAFGRKNPRLLRLISISVFKKQSINPMPGLQVGIDGALGVVRSVTGGRVVVDFNHPLAGKNILYDIRAIRIVKDSKEKLGSLVKMGLGIRDFDIAMENENTHAKISLKTGLPELPAEIKDMFSEKAKELAQVDAVEFITEKR